MSLCSVYSSIGVVQGGVSYSPIEPSFSPLFPSLSPSSPLYLDLVDDDAIVNTL